MALEPDPAQLAHEHLDSEHFVNEPLNVDELPRLRDDEFVPIDPNFLKVSLMGSALFAAITIVAGVAASLIVNRQSWIPLVIMAGLLAVTAAGAALRVLEVRHIAYQVRAHDISYRSGVLIKTVSTVPFVRVQHARISQGPVQRRFAIATLEVNSAGPDLAIRGLASATAEQLKVLIVERAGDLVEDL